MEVTLVEEHYNPTYRVEPKQAVFEESVVSERIHDGLKQ